MPQMFQYCGQRIQVYKRAHKTCDTASGAYVGRRLRGGVHLQHRCDGQAYGGCQAGCLIFWKEAWLKPVAGDGCSRCQHRQAIGRQDKSPIARVARKMMFWRATKDAPPGRQPRYRARPPSCSTSRSPSSGGMRRQFVETYTFGQRRVPRNRVWRLLSFLLLHAG